MWLIANWRLLSYGTAIIAIFSSGWYISSQIAKTHLQNELKHQEEALNAQCIADKKLTNEVSNGLQKKLSTTAARLSELKRMHATTACVPIAGTSSGYDDSSGAKLVRPNGIIADTLLDYAGDAEKYRQQLESCQDFIKKVWNR